MGIVSPHARLLFLTVAKSDIEYRLMMISAKMQLLSTQTAEVSSQMYNKLQPYVSGVDPKDQDSVLTDLKNSEAFSLEYELQMQQFNSAQNVLDVQKKQAEAQQKAITQEIESEQKILDKNLKDISISGK